MLIFFVFHSSIKETKQKLTNNRTTGEGKYKFEFMKKKKKNERNWCWMATDYHCTGVRHGEIGAYNRKTADGSKYKIQLMG